MEKKNKSWGRFMHNFDVFQGKLFSIWDPLSQKKTQKERTFSLNSHFWRIVLVLSIKNVSVKIKNFIFPIKYTRYGKMLRNKILFFKEIYKFSGEHFYILIMDEKVLVLCEKWLSKFSSNIYVLRTPESEKMVFTKVSVCLSVGRVRHNSR